ncbi:MAG: DUF2382 domain-containing protein [Chitinivibrionales bacterium]|nr:DUF2382 domain-containing protein [Chitinivibrionales bacterium]
MTTKTDFQATHAAVKKGMDAYTRDGEKLGTIKELGEDSLLVEKGFFFPKDYTFRYDDIADIHNDRAIFGFTKEELKHWQDESYGGWNEYDRRSAEEGERRSTEEGERIPLREEKLEAHAEPKRTGEVRARKVVHSEIRSFDVPVSKEEVVVERKPAREGEEPRGGEAFKEEETRIPVTEEEVEVSKHPVHKEDVEVRKEKRTEREPVKSEVRREDVELTDEGETRRR